MQIVRELCCRKIKYSLFQVALKIIDLDKTHESYLRKNVLRESAILKNLRHDNIVRLYETLAHRNVYCFVTEYLEGGDLFTRAKREEIKREACSEIFHTVIIGYSVSSWQRCYSQVRNICYRVLVKANSSEVFVFPLSCSKSAIKVLKDVK